ncbi:MAG: Homoserine dehydrogenase [Alphaproteobacteria bacterium MarineAlpha5_Bin12]|nr:homoserine dehydrogenase [Pelagibacteraceae bacterium]PPR41825.1 MAG: Homoserine dehydrogenase [Alphaproteobacteria bacterium MarineAlpha5_Bin12]|tara:strand:- start:2141 stop:3442 length:1302 start_codon:yes stop_codon:yes gene_type:complete
MSDFNICIAGLGTVGSSLINIIEKNKNKIENRLNKKIKIVGITAKNKRKKRSFLTDNYNWYDDPLKMIKDCKPNLFIELMGYEKEISYNSIKFAIKNKVNIITANKALIAHNGNELISLAEKNQVSFLFEASVAAAIPIINTLKSMIISNKIIKILGILNGTTNYILSNMTNNNISFSEALKDAKKKGYVESNPDLDLEGIDSAHKLSILTSLAFGLNLINFNEIYREGIANIELQDIEFSKKLGLVIKLVSIVEQINNKIRLYVKPMMLNKNSRLGKVDGVLNGIQIQSKDIEDIFLEGQGAGGYATASSIISDIYDICINGYSPAFGIKFNKLKKIDKLSVNKDFNSFYLRLNVLDKKGVLAKITKLFNENNISIETMIQNPKNMKIKNNSIPLIIITHKTYLQDINNLIKKISNLLEVKDKPFFMQIYKV